MRRVGGIPLVIMSSQAVYRAELVWPLLGSGNVITINSELEEFCRNISVSLRCLIEVVFSTARTLLSHLLVFSLSFCRCCSGMLQPSIIASNSALVEASAFLVTSGTADTVS